MSPLAEQVYTRERVAEIERQYAKLSAAFAETDPELLVERVLRMTTGSQSEKVENMNRDAEAAKERAAVLRDELLQHQTRLEEMRCAAEQRPFHSSRLHTKPFPTHMPLATAPYAATPRFHAPPSPQPARTADRAVCGNRASLSFPASRGTAAPLAFSC